MCERQGQDNKSLANGSEERHAEDDEVASILEALCKLPLNLSTYQWLKQNEIGYTIRDIAKDYNTVPKRLRKLAQDVKEHRRGPSTCSRARSSTWGP